jgi:hypothetical protein
MNPVSPLLRLAAGVLLIVILQAAGPASAGEPTNATEAAAKKGAADRATAEAFGKWKSQKSLEQQAWETVLEQNLGSFYLPIYQREKLAGKETAWDFVPDNPALPRVLLIGDSINDLYAHIAPRLQDFQKANDVHFSEAGYIYFGGKVAAKISAALPGPRGR